MSRRPLLFCRGAILLAACRAAPAFNSPCRRSQTLRRDGAREPSQRTGNPTASSAVGHSRRFDAPPVTSGLPRSTDIIRPAQLVRFVPQADILTIAAIAYATCQFGTPLCSFDGLPVSVIINAEPRTDFRTAINAIEVSCLRLRNAHSCGLIGHAAPRADMNDDSLGARHTRKPASNVKSICRSLLSVVSSWSRRLRVLGRLTSPWGTTYHGCNSR
jgi:hypothetical protein